MDRISELSDELLVKILSFLPTKAAVSTSILSKRWECHWMWLPKLDFVGPYSSPSECERLRRFLDRNLPLHRAQAMESFRLDLSSSSFFKHEGIKMWVLTAVSRHLRELEISVHASHQNILPSSLYTCKSLVTLKLDGNILLDVPRNVGLPSLKTLQLQRVKFLDGDTFRRLLSICHVLEDLLVKFRRGIGVNMGMITVIVPSLRSLSLELPFDCLSDGLVIDTPSLKYLKLEDYKEYNHSCLVENMPKLMEAYVDVNFPDIHSLIGSITSVKRLMLSSEAVYGGGHVFNQLEHLKLCIGTDYLSDLLVRLLQGSPKLRELDLFDMDRRYGDLVSWNQPDTVPTCIVSSLQTFNWSGYLGRAQEIELAVYILKNASRLKTATFSSDNSYIPKFEMIKELSLSSRASTTCQLLFD